MIIIDAGYLTARSRYVFKNLKTSQEKPVGAIYGFLSTVKQIRKNYPQEQIIVCLDSYSQWRVNLSSRYKAERESHKEGWLGSEEQHQHGFEKETIKKIVSSVPNVTVIEAEEAEADDLIAITASRNPGSIILSADKDMWQLTRFNIRIAKNIEKGKLICLNYPKEFENIPPQNLALYRAIMGDAGDGIQKLPRVSTIEVQAMARRCSTPGDLFEDKEFKETKSFQIIDNNYTQLLVNYELCKLPPDRSYYIERYEGTKEEALELIEKLELYSMRGLLN